MRIQWAFREFCENCVARYPATLLPAGRIFAMGKAGCEKESCHDRMIGVQMLPDSKGHFGPFGGRFIPETLMPAVVELAAAYRAARRDPQFRKDLDYYLREYAGRPTPLTFAERFTRHCGGAKVYLKREDLLHTGAHKINNTLGPGAAGAADGQEARHRGDRRGPARRRHRRRRGALRLRVRGVHGRGGHPPAGAERLPHAHARRAGRAGRHRRAHAQGRDERGDARLDGHRPRRRITSSARSSGRILTR